MRTSVVLPAPFGPSRPNTIPAGTSSPAPSSAMVAPKRLTTPSTRTAGTEEPRPFAGPVPGLTRLVLLAPRRSWEAACKGASVDGTCSLSAVMSISSTGPCGSPRQIQVCRQAGDRSSPDRGDPPARRTHGMVTGEATLRRLPWVRPAFAVPPSKICDWGGLNEKDLCQGAGGVDGPPLGVGAAPSGVPADGASGDDDDAGRDLGIAGADGLPGLFQHGQHAAGGLRVPAWHAGAGPRRGGRAGPAVAVAVGVVLQVGGQVFAGFGDQGPGKVVFMQPEAGLASASGRGRDGGWRRRCSCGRPGAGC